MQPAEIYDILKTNWHDYRNLVPARHLQTIQRIRGLDPGLKGIAIRLALSSLGVLRDGGMVFISGPVGVGKTISAVILAIVFQEKCRQNFRIIQSSDILKNEFTGRQTYVDWRSLVIVDDLGREYFRADNDFGPNIYENYFDTSYREKFPRIFTTNLTTDEFQARYGPRVYDRCREVATWLTVEEPNGSFRGREN